MKHRTVFVLILLAVFFSVPAAANISISGADTISNFSFFEAGISTAQIPETEIFVSGADSLLPATFFAANISASQVPMPGIFLSGEDSYVPNTFFSVNISTSQVPISEIFLSGEDSSSLSSFSNFSNLTSNNSVDGIFISGMDVKSDFSLCAVNISTSQVPMPEIFISGEDSSSSVFLSNFSLLTPQLPITEIFLSGEDSIVSRQLIREEEAGDLIPPTLSITTPSQNQVVSKPIINVSGTASDNDALKEVTVNGFFAGAEEWSKAIELVEGENVITVVARDLTGNENKVTLKVFYNPVSVYVNVSGTTVTFNATKEGNPFKDAVIYIDGQTSSCGSTGSDGTLLIISTEGSHEWCAYYYGFSYTPSKIVGEGSYNVSDISVSVTVSGTSVTFTALQDNKTLSDVNIYIDGIYFGDTGSSGTLSKTCSEGAHEWYAKYRGNTVDQGSYNVSDISVSAIVSGTQVVFTATQDENPVSNVRIYIDGTRYGSTNSDGFYQVSSTEGTHSWYGYYSSSVPGKVDEGTYNVSDISVSAAVSGTQVVFTATQGENPVSNVRIHIDGNWYGYTNSAGIYQITSTEGAHDWYGYYSSSVPGKVDEGTYNVSDISVSAAVSGTQVVFTATQGENPVSNVRIHIDGNWYGYTNSAGIYQITSTEGAHDWYGYYSSSVPGKVDEGTFNVSDISVSAAVSGTQVVFTATQGENPVSNVRIHIDGNWYGYTNSAGIYQITSTEGAHDWYGYYSSSVPGKVDEGIFNVSGLPADTTPPASITNLRSVSSSDSHILWAWDNPLDSDFSHTMVYLDGIFVADVSSAYYNATGLLPGSSHTIGTHTVDINGNVNYAWVNDMASTVPAQFEPLYVTVNEPEEYSVCPAGDSLLFDVGVSDFSGNAVASGILVYAELLGPEGNYRHVAFSGNGSNFTGEYVVGQDDPAGWWAANITAYNATFRGQASVYLLFTGPYLIRAESDAGTYLLGETAEFTAVAFRPENSSNVLDGSELDLNFSVYPFNDSAPVFGPDEMVYSATSEAFTSYLQTDLLGSGLFTVVFTGKDAYGDVENSSLFIGVSENFTVDVSTDKPFYDRGDQVNISGAVRFENGTPLSNVPVDLEIDLRDFKRTYRVNTDAYGEFNYSFQPFDREAGLYSIKASAANLGLVNTGEESFTVNGLYLTTSSATLEMAENSEMCVNLTLSNLGDSALTGIRAFVQDNNVSDSVDAVIDPLTLPGELLPHENKSVVLKLTAGDLISGFAEFRVEFTSDQFSEESGEFKVRVFSQAPLVGCYPEDLDVGMECNRTVIKTITVTNSGFGPLKNVTLQQPSVSWMRVYSDTALGDIQPGEGVSFDILINSYNVVHGVYRDSLIVRSENHADVPVNLTARITELSTGGVLFNVRNAFGENVSNAEVSLFNRESYEEFSGFTDFSGRLLLSGLPSGSYLFDVLPEESHIYPESGELLIEAGEEPEVVYLCLDMSGIDFDWEIDWGEDENGDEHPPSVEDNYKITLKMKFETDVPTPLLIALPPSIQYDIIPGEEKTGSFILFNAGLVSVNNVSISQISCADFTLIPLVDFVDEIKANSSIQVPYRLETSPDWAVGEEFSGELNAEGSFIHFINDSEVTACVGARIPVHLATIEEKNRLSVDPPIIFYFTNGEEVLATNCNEDLSGNVLTATNRNTINDISLSYAIGATGKVDISIFVPAVFGVPLPPTSVGAPFDGYSGSFTPSTISPGQSADLTMEKYEASVGLSLPGLVGGGIFFWYGHSSYDQMRLVPIIGFDYGFDLGNFEVNYPSYSPCYPVVNLGPRVSGPCYITYPGKSPSPSPSPGSPAPDSTDDETHTEITTYNVVLPPIHEIVKISVSQDAVMERDVFKAGLGIRNNMLRTNIEDVKVVLNIEGENGPANDMFFIKAPSLRGISDINGSGVVFPSSVAISKWVIIPEPGAGGTSPEGNSYTISANISYSIGGVDYETSTSGARFVVKPQPELVLDYFIPSEVLSKKPFKLAVKATNEGYGTARDFSIETAQPVIYDNPSGLLVDFKIIGSALQGQSRDTSLKVDFGDIQPNESKIAWWDMVSSLSGTFTEFIGEFTHSDELGGKETSLIKEVNTYIIQKDVDTGEIGFDFLVSSEFNQSSYFLLDTSDGSFTPVRKSAYNVVEPPTFEKKIMIITVEDCSGKWFIVSLEDPYSNEVMIHKIIRYEEYPEIYSAETDQPLLTAEAEVGAEVESEVEAEVEAAVPMSANLYAAEESPLLLYVEGQELPPSNYWMEDGKIFMLDYYGDGFSGDYEIIYVDSNPPASISNLTSVSGPEWINWTWNNPSDPDFDHVEVYLNGIFHTNVSGEFLNVTGLFPDTAYTISIRTADIYSNINETWVNGTANTGEALTKTFEISLKEGWNLISLPLQPEDLSIASVLAPISGNYGIIWAYDASDSLDPWKKYDPSVPFGNDLLEMEAGSGYWILMGAEDTLPVTGSLPVLPVSGLEPGWNLIGYTSLSSQPITDVLSSISSNYSIVWAYDASDTADPWKKYDPSVPFGNDLTEMEPGKGYWILEEGAGY